MVPEFLSYTCSLRVSSILKFKVQSISNGSQLFRVSWLCPTCSSTLNTEEEMLCELSLQQGILVIVDVDLRNSYPPTFVKYTTTGCDCPCDVLASVCPLVLSIWAISVLPAGSWETISDSSGVCITSLGEIVTVQSYFPPSKNYHFFQN